MADTLPVAEEASTIPHNSIDTPVTTDGHITDVKDIEQTIAKEDITENPHVDVLPETIENGLEAKQENGIAEEYKKDASLTVDEVKEVASIELAVKEDIGVRVCDCFTRLMAELATYIFSSGGDWRF